LLSGQLKYYVELKTPSEAPFSVMRAITLVQTELVANPGILGRTLHARIEEAILLQHPTPHLAHIRQVADPLVGIQILGLAVPGLELMQLIAGRGMAHPLNRLLIGHKMHIRQLLQIVKEFLSQQQAIKIKLHSLLPTLTRKAFR